MNTREPSTSKVIYSTLSVHSGIGCCCKPCYSLYIGAWKHYILYGWLPIQGCPGPIMDCFKHTLYDSFTPAIVLGILQTISTCALINLNNGLLVICGLRKYSFVCLSCYNSLSIMYDHQESAPQNITICTQPSLMTEQLKYGMAARLREKP